MPTFDVVSKVDHAEVKNAFVQAEKELAQRFDFKGTDASLELADDSVTVKASTDERVRAAYDILVGKLTRRNVSLKHFETEKTEASGQSSRKMRVSIKEGIPADKAKKIVKLIKEAGLKVSASIVEDTVRVSGKKRDELQDAIAFLRTKADELELSLQYQNFRD